MTESVAGHFINFYKQIGKGDWRRSGHMPDDATIWECLVTLQKYYTEYLQWYARVRPKLRPKEDIVIGQYQRRLQQIKQAIQSDDKNYQIKAIDDGINQWHIDYPVLAHLEMEAEGDDKLDNPDEKEWHELYTILTSLGKLSKQSPNKPPKVK